MVAMLKCYRSGAGAVRDHGSDLAGTGLRNYVYS